MTDYPVLIPTEAGPLGAMVHVPEGEPRGAVIILQGDGPPCRAGINAHWTRLARDFADTGMLALRFDYIRTGESFPVAHDEWHGHIWKAELNLAMLREVITWFRSQTGLRKVVLVASCYGGRLGVELASSDEDVNSTFFVSPYLATDPSIAPKAPADGQSRSTPVPAAGGLPGDARKGEILDETFERFSAMLTHGSCSILIGEEEFERVAEIEPRLGPEASRLKIEVVSGKRLDPIRTPEIQALVSDWLLSRVPA